MEDQKLDEIVKRAKAKFFAELVDCFPSIHTNNYAIESTEALDEAFDEILQTWLYSNAPVQLISWGDEEKPTRCPVCGVEYSQENAFSEAYYDTINYVMDLYRHKKCGAIVRFEMSDIGLNPREE